MIAAALLLGVPLVSVPAAPAKAGDTLIQLFNLGCAVGHSVVHGCLLTSAKGPIAPGGPIIGNKEGRACGWNILSLFAWGDLRITTAMKNAGITQISSVDSHAFELVPGFYGINRYCTVVSGR